MATPDTSSHYFGQPACTLENRPSRDILWDRLIFRAPSLLNLRVIFDPPPFRTQSFAGRRPSESFPPRHSRTA
jgi:hypothetical protein